MGLVWHSLTAKPIKEYAICRMPAPPLGEYPLILQHLFFSTSPGVDPGEDNGRDCRKTITSPATKVWTKMAAAGYEENPPAVRAAETAIERSDRAGNLRKGRRG
jgi:hypothetical protein